MRILVKINNILFFVRNGILDYFGELIEKWKNSAFDEKKLRILRENMQNVVEILGQEIALNSSKIKRILQNPSNLDFDFNSELERNLSKSENLEHLVKDLFSYNLIAISKLAQCYKINGQKDILRSQ